MDRNKTAYQAPVTAAEWFAGGQRILYDPGSARARRERVPGAEILTFPGGHLTTGEHPDLLAAAIRDIATRHGVATPAIASK